MERNRIAIAAASRASAQKISVLRHCRWNHSNPSEKPDTTFNRQAQYRKPFGKF